MKMFILVTAVFLGMVQASELAGQAHVPDQYSEDGVNLNRIPSRCLVALDACKAKCQECSSCYEEYLDCVESSMPPKYDNEVRSSQIHHPPQRPDPCKESNDGEEEILQLCVKNFADCKRHCTESGRCSEIFLECINNVSSSGKLKNPVKELQDVLRTTPFPVDFEETTQKPPVQEKEDPPSPVYRSSDMDTPDEINRDTRKSGVSKTKDCKMELNKCLTYCSYCGDCVVQYRECTGTDLELVEPDGDPIFP